MTGAGCIESVYGLLIVRHHKAARDEDKELAERIYAALTLFEHLWPEECNRWRERFSS